MHAHARLLIVGSQFSSGGCWSCVRTSTGWSALASTSVFVENRPRSTIQTDQYIFELHKLNRQKKIEEEIRQKSQDNRQQVANGNVSIIN